MEFLIVGWLTCALVTPLVALYRGRPALRWLGVGLLLGFVGLVVIALVPPVEDPPDPWSRNA